jgi:nucleotide-binding universal stress UspA family protein
MSNTLLLLSTATPLQTGVERAIEEAKKIGGRLIILFVADVALPNSVLERLEGADFVGGKPGQEVYEALMNEYQRQGEQLLAKAQTTVESAGVPVETIFKVGSIADECIATIKNQEIDVAVLTRKKRSHLSRFIFGSPIKQIQDSVTCHFIIVEDEN